MRSPRRWRPLVAATLALLGLGPANPTAAAPVLGDDDGDRAAVSFDWPLECPVAVAQETYSYGGDPELLLVAEYDITLIDTAAPDDVEIHFGPPEITAAMVDGEELSSLPPVGTPDHAQLLAAASAPVLAVELDGSPAVDIGYESWLEEAGLDAEDLGRTDAELRRWIDYRATWSAWATWVGRWAELGTVPLGTFDADASNALEFGSSSTSPITIEATRDGDGLLVVRTTTELRGPALDELWAFGGGVDPATNATEPSTEATRSTWTEVVTDPATLQPRSATYGVDLITDRVVSSSLTTWAFTWPDCSDAARVGDLREAAATTAPPAVEPSRPDVDVPPGFDIVTLDELPPEALDTLALIERGGPFPYEKDGSVFGNFEGLLPDRPRGYYREYTVETPGSDDRGARRIVTGGGGEIYYTDDHYESFRVVVP